MRYRKLGSSDLEVSEISLGSWLTYSGGVELDRTRACTDAAFEAGINFFDTANVYGRGAAETAWGEILSGRPRDSYVLATKVWGQMSDDPGDRGLSAAHIAKEIDASLGRLQTDHVDLYQAHRFDPDVPIEETIEALQQVVASGKARYLGFSEWTTEQIQAAIDIAPCGRSRSAPTPRRRGSSCRPTCWRRSMRRSGTRRSSSRRSRHSRKQG
jgi:aryl-alcohol dehydrogenase-like predicted oxidoreductase